jgi:hypothetical protein
MAAADITVVHGGVGAVADAVMLARATRRIIRQNLGWAFGYNLVLVPLAAVGVLPPVLAAVAMATSSVTVVSNALRLRRFAKGGHPSPPLHRGTATHGGGADADRGGGQLMNPATIELTVPDISCEKCKANIEGDLAGEPGRSAWTSPPDASASPTTNSTPAPNGCRPVSARSATRPLRDRPADPEPSGSDTR